jgi:hypothetical protein
MKPPKGLFTDHGHRQRYKATGEFRKPKAGEFFLSGAIIGAYLAPNDLPFEYWIAAPVQVKKCPCCGVGEVEA